MSARPRAALLAFCAAATALAPNAPAHAVGAPLVVVAHSPSYAPADFTIVEGSTLTLVNGDTLDHDLRSLDTSGGHPLFRSAIIPTGGTAPVNGVAALTGPNVYPFYCSLHEDMKGNITVTPAPAR
jgi:plastocyanin